ncbi:hypothetical protein B0H16DRAFT_1733187 [Mycena metata]|uniref:F-box domain-containing protein n=1 Tax=Mycena metata TaxID=1033252 RepID=A0AAD7HZ45_9AGAR|nr:hypothetical protein B0H16DRAFT_1733187 [Mycena metata]
MTTIPGPPTTSHLPVEIWRQILRVATQPEIPYIVDYLAFEAMDELKETSRSQSLRMETSLSLIRVSRCFHAIGVEFMYEDVRVYDAAGLQSLLSGLYRSLEADGANGYGSYIRRLELPSRRNPMRWPSHSPDFSNDPIPSDLDKPRLGDVLRLCPRLETLVRPYLRLDAENMMFWASLVEGPVIACLSHLKRLEWYESVLEADLYGTKRLGEIIAQAPNLRYLSLSSDRHNLLADLPFSSSLQTLRINRSQYYPANNKKYLVRPRRSRFPNLTNLVLQTTLPTPLLDLLGTRGLRRLEFGFSPQMTFSSTEMHRIFSRCQWLEELVYYLGAPEISALVAFQAPSVKRVRLRINPEEWSSPRSVIRRQLEILEGPSFPKLEELVLQDPTGWFLRRDLGKDFLGRMVARGCKVRYED